MSGRKEGDRNRERAREKERDEQVCVYILIEYKRVCCISESVVTGNSQPPDEDAEN